MANKRNRTERQETLDAVRAEQQAKALPDSSTPTPSLPRPPGLKRHAPGEVTDNARETRSNSTTDSIGKRTGSPLMEHQERIWFVDPATLQDVVVDRDAMEARLDNCTDLERVWVLSLLGRGEEAVSEAQKVLAASEDPFRALLVLAYAYQRLYRWQDAARIQEQALRRARTKFKEAQVRHQIGRRLFDEGLYLAAAAEFDWAAALFKAAGRSRAAFTSSAARDRARKVHRQSRLFD